MVRGPGSNLAQLHENTKEESNIINSKWDVGRPTSANEYKLCMRVWVNTWAMLNPADSDGGIFSDALCGPRGPSV